MQIAKRGTSHCHQTRISILRKVWLPMKKRMKDRARQNRTKGFVSNRNTNENNSLHSSIQPRERDSNVVELQHKASQHGSPNRKNTTSVFALRQKLPQIKQYVSFKYIFRRIYSSDAVEGYSFPFCSY